MTTQHTPGPWDASGTVFSGPDGMIGEVGFGKRDDPEMIANARLIAAAPDLLAALHKIGYEPIGHAEASDRQILEDITQIARSAIATARGSA